MSKMERSRSRSKSPKKEKSNLFEYVPTDIVGKISSYLEPEQMTNWKLTGKSMKDVIESGAKNFDPTNVSYQNRTLKFKSKLSPIEFQLYVETPHDDFTDFRNNLGKKDDSVDIDIDLGEKFYVRSPMGMNEIKLSNPDLFNDRGQGKNNYFKVNIVQNNKNISEYYKLNVRVKLHLNYIKKTNQIQVEIRSVSLVDRPGNRRFTLTEPVLDFEMDVDQWLIALDKIDREMGWF